MHARRFSWPTTLFLLKSARTLLVHVRRLKCARALLKCMCMFAHEKCACACEKCTCACEKCTCARGSARVHLRCAHVHLLCSKTDLTSVDRARLTAIGARSLSTRRKGLERVFTDTSYPGLELWGPREEYEIELAHSSTSFGSEFSSSSMCRPKFSETFFWSSPSFRQIIWSDIQ